SATKSAGRPPTTRRPAPWRASPGATSIRTTTRRPETDRPRRLVVLRDDRDDGRHVGAASVTISLSIRGAVARADVVLRSVQAGDELGPVVLLSGEYTEWARRRVLADYGVDLEFESEQDLFRDLDSMRQARSRLYLAELRGEPVGMGALRPLGAEVAEIKRMYV